MALRSRSIRAARRRRAQSGAVIGSLPLLLAAPAPGRQGAPPPATTPPAQSEVKPREQTGERLPEVVVTAKDAEQAGEFQHTPLDNTAARDVLTPAEILQSGVISVQEVMRRTPSAHVWDETGSDSLPNIALRGVTGNEGASRSINVALTVDGIPLASAPYGHPGASLFPFVVERLYAVDVQRGGASVRYGPNNVAGVVNYLTRPIPLGSLVEVGARYDSFSNGSLYSALGGTYGELGVLFEGVYKDGETFRENGEYTIQNYALKAGYLFNPDFRALFQVEQFDDESNLSDGLTWADYQADPDQSTALQNRFEGEQQRVSAKLEWQLAPRTKAELISYYYDSERAFFLGSPTSYGNNPTYIQATPRPMTVWALQPQLSHQYELFGAQGEALVGVRYLEEDITRRVERYFPNGTQTLNADAQFDYQAASLFAETSLVFGDWRVTPGVRFEQVDIDAEDTLSGFTTGQNFSEALPALGASYLVSDEWSVYANVQSSFKAPEAQHIELSPDPQDISAQYAWLYELGTRAQLLEQQLTADLTVYQIDYQDRLEPDPDQLDVFNNIGESSHRGVELALDGDLSQVALEGLGLWATAAYNDSEYRSGQYDGNQVVGAPHWLLSWGATWKHARSGLWAGLDGFYVDEAYSDAANTEPINAAGTRGVRPSYTVWNARVGLTRPLSKHCQLRATVLARNLLDEEYFEIRAGRGIYPGAPFSYGAELGISFSY